MQNLSKFAVLAGLSLTLTACAMGAIDYNNRIVDEMEVLADLTELTIDTYEEIVPVAYEAELYGDLAELQATLDEAEKAFEVIPNELLGLESLNSDQQATARTGMQDYYDSTVVYFDYFQEMLDLHVAGVDPEADFDMVYEKEERLYELYNESIGIFNQLGDDMWTYVQ